MKKYIKRYFVLGLLLLSVGCGKDFLNRPPEMYITEETFWKNTNDMETFANQFYPLFGGYGSYDAGNFWADANSDNLIPASYNPRISGFSVTPPYGASLDYVNIRSVNYFLEKGQAVETNLVDEKNALLGEGYFFRAFLYYALLNAYGGVPWIEKVLTTESPELYAARESRDITVDRILADLDKAVEYLKPAISAVPFRVNKEVALALQSRVALFEGTWEKYHMGTSFGVTGGNYRKYLEIAVRAAKDLMDAKYGKLFSVYSSGDPNKDYFDLFNQDDLSGNSEIIFWKKYSNTLKVGHNSQRSHGIFPNNLGVSKALVDNYLCANGKPINNSDGAYRGDNLPDDIFKNRDPRLKQLVFVKGDPITINIGDTVRKFNIGQINLPSLDFCPTGFHLKKGSNPENRNARQTTDFSSETAYIFFRFGEVLLNYAEAKAELGTLTQQDVDISVNLLRDRVNMPHLQIDNITIDPGWDFPGISPLLNEIRRERRSELACEGFRLDDIRRWRAHHLITGVKPLGIKFDQAVYPGMQVGVSVFLSSGFVDPYALILPNGWGFKPERDYLLPLTLEELELNKSLDQNPGWDTP